MKVWHNLYNDLITKHNIYRAYNDFLKGKKGKKDVIYFNEKRYENLNVLYEAFVNKTYKPGIYSKFLVQDPKVRIIHKAQVVDRIVHHIVSDILEKIFEPTFIFHSYACRGNKGTHKGVLALKKMALKESYNDTRTCWILKCDISKFFSSINHKILRRMLSAKIKDQDFLELLEKIVESFYSDKTVEPTNKKGIPIGNLTSQFFSNVYLDKLDQYVKHELKVKYYIRYADDFIFVSYDRKYLIGLIELVSAFLKRELDLEMHPKKIILEKFSSGVDFLGYIIFPNHILPRTTTKRRLTRRIRKKIYEFKKGKTTEKSLNQTIQSYYGYLSHGNTYKFKQELQNQIWFWLTE